MPSSQRRYPKSQHHQRVNIAYFGEALTSDEVITQLREAEEKVFGRKEQVKKRR